MSEIVNLMSFQALSSIDHDLLTPRFKAFKQRNFTMTFYGLMEGKDNVKRVGNFFYRSSLFCFFPERFRFEQYANIILMTPQCIMTFSAVWISLTVSMINFQNLH